MPTGSPVYQRVDSDGTVTNDFEGRISASGITIRAGEGGTLGPQNRIDWVKQGGGLVASTGTFEGSGVIQHQGSAYAGAGQYAYSFLSSHYQSSSGSAIYTRAGPPAIDNEVIANANSGANSHTVKIIDSNSNSSFLKTLSSFNGDTINYGTSSMTFSASSEAATVVSHGLGRVPKFAVAIPIMNTGEALFSSVRGGSITSSSIVFQFNTATVGVPITATRSFFWMVIG